MNIPMHRRFQRHFLSGESGHYIIKNSHGAYLQIAQTYGGGSPVEVSLVLAAGPTKIEAKPLLAWTPFRELGAQFHKTPTYEYVRTAYVMIPTGKIEAASWMVGIETANLILALPFVRDGGGRLVFVHAKKHELPPRIGIRAA